MIVQHQLSVSVRNKEAAVHLHHIIRDLDPGALCVKIFLQRLCQLHIAEILVIVELKLLIHGDHFIYIDITKTALHPLQFLLMKPPQDARLFCSRRDRIVVSVKRHRLSRPADKIQLQHLVQHAVMHVDCARMKLMVRLRFIHLRHFSARAFCLPSPVYELHVIFHDQLEAGPVHIPQAVIPCRERRPRPGKPSGKAFHLLCVHKDRDHLAKLGEKRGVIQRQRHLRRCRPDVRQLDKQIIRIHNSALTRP